MNYYFNQLAGGLGVLKDSGATLDWKSINGRLKAIAQENGPASCDTEETIRMHKEYRSMCIGKGLIRVGELFNHRDVIPLV